MQPIVKALLSRPEISALVMLLVVVVGLRALRAAVRLQRQHPRDAVRAARARHRGAGRRHPDDRRRVRPVGGLGVRAVADADGRRRWASGACRPSSRSCWASASPWRSATSTAGSRWPSASRASSPRWACCSWPARSRTVLSGGFPPPFPANTPTWLFVADLGQFRASMLWYGGLRHHPRRDAALLQSRELDLRHRRPAPGGRRHGHRHPPGEAVLLHAVQLPGRLRRHDHHLPPQVRPAGAGRGPGAAGDRGRRDRRHRAHRRHRLGDRHHRRHLPDPRDRQRPGHGPHRRQLVPLRDRCAHHRGRDPEHHRAPARAADAEGRGHDRSARRACPAHARPSSGRAPMR